MISLLAFIFFIITGGAVDPLVSYVEEIEEKEIAYDGCPVGRR